MRTCKKCGVEKELTTHFFGRSKASLGGYLTSCKPCNADRKCQYSKKYRATHKESIAASAKKYKMPDAVRARRNATSATYRLNNKEKVKLNQAAYFAKHRVRLIELGKVRSKEWLKNNRDKAHATRKAWEAKNKKGRAEYRKAYLAENRGTIAAYKKEYWEKNRVHLSEYRMEHARKNPEEERGRREAAKNSDCYMLRMLGGGSAPQELIKAKRLQLQILRETRKCK